MARSRFEPRRSRPRSSVLDPFKPRIIRLLDSHSYSAQQIFQRLREEGYRGGVTILRDYVRCIRPTKRPVYLKLHFAPGECVQVDWGAYGTVAVGNTRRRLSFFVMVLAFRVTFTGLIGQLGDPHYSRKANALYYEFEEIGLNKQLGYGSPTHLVDRYPQFYLGNGDRLRLSPDSRPEVPTW